MFDAEQSAEILNKVLSACTLLSPTDLEDQTCHICQNDSLGAEGTEKATKLSCGQILVVRTKEWGSEADLLDEAIGGLAKWNPGQLPGLFEDETKDQIRRAEELWDRFCSGILESLEAAIRTERPRPLYINTKQLLGEAGPVAQRILSFGSVYNF
ncbi:MAG: hypothetical protein Q9222_004877 [Ikaeria aurantiellina]